MNKTVSINLGGLFFHIDENAYQKLNHYFDAIRSSLLPDGKDEIMNDIESRIAELLIEKLKNDKQVVGMREVEEVIEVMGQPEDYRLDDDGTTEKAEKDNDYYVPPGYSSKRTRKFFRDGEKSIISGVCAGIAHYFRIDPLWVRIIFILSLFISFGTSVIIYIILSILIPKAITTTEKLEMTGDPINISNIERKVREEFDALGKKIKNVDYDKLGANAKSGAENLGNGFEKVLMGIFKGFSKLIGALITIFSALSLVGLVIAFFTMLFTSSMQTSLFYPYADGVNYTDLPIWLAGLFGLLAVGIPLFCLLLLGLKILIENLRSIGSLAKYTLLALWITSIAGIVYISISVGNEISHEGKTFVREDINITKNDTLNLKFKYNNYFDKSWHSGDGFRITQDIEGNDIIYSNDVRLYVMKTDEAEPYLQVEKISLGKSISEARKRAEFINYNFQIEGNNLVLDNYLTTETSQKYRNQSIEIFLYLPEGIHFKPDSSVKHYDATRNSFFDLWYDSENIYRMDKNKVECITCNENEEETEEIKETERVKIEVHGQLEIPKQIEEAIRIERTEKREKPEKPEKPEKREKPEKFNL
ncbi:PspC domain-containing protein [Flavobacterium arcticum]|uniref:PspC domain-containing protein n=1 Tax=Flavobacterium arcticum TaxID=1784713 RepID=A0A345H868_9FLAO|nr:PspC domain-containing protein [Flavobacterium arcticum]AXG72778.1 PspC domain-containing protein [Flavobacterium arcticum]KAF2510952.1 PspC domain-containing protein [Flavobacterium arcticum]